MIIIISFCWALSVCLWCSEVIFCFAWTVVTEQYQLQENNSWHCRSPSLSSPQPPVLACALILNECDWQRREALTFISLIKFTEAKASPREVPALYLVQTQTFRERKGCRYNLEAIEAEGGGTHLGILSTLLFLVPWGRVTSRSTN